VVAFLQTDPIPGGSANNYDYADQDPVNNFDLDGTAVSPGQPGKDGCYAANTNCHSTGKDGWQVFAAFFAKHRSTIVSLVAASVCVVSFGACVIATTLAYFVRVQQRGRGHGSEDAADAAATFFGLFLVGGTSKLGEGAVEEGSFGAIFLKVHAALPDLISVGAGAAASYTNRAQ
jgi:hypothetical protein